MILQNIQSEVNLIFKSLRSFIIFDDQKLDFLKDIKLK